MRYLMVNRYFLIVEKRQDMNQHKDSYFLQKAIVNGQTKTVNLLDNSEKISLIQNTKLLNCRLNSQLFVPEIILIFFRDRVKQV